MLLLAAILATETKPMGDLPTFGTGCTYQSRLLRLTQLARAIANEPRVWFCADQYELDVLELYVSQDQEILAVVADTGWRGQRCLERRVEGLVLGDEPLPADPHWRLELELDRDARSIYLGWLRYQEVPD